MFGNLYHLEIALIWDGEEEAERDAKNPSKLDLSSKLTDSVWFRAGSVQTQNQIPFWVTSGLRCNENRNSTKSNTKTG